MPRDWPHPLDPEPTAAQVRRWRIEAWAIAVAIIVALVAAIGVDA